MSASPTELRRFEAIYRTESPYVASLLLRLGLPRSAVQDVTQEVFITAFRRWTDYDPERPIRAWLFGIARKLAFRSRRTEARHRRKLGALRDVRKQGLAERADPTTAKVLLHRLVEELDEKVAEVFLLADFGGYTAKEIETKTGLNSDQIYYRLRVARQHLRASLEEDQTQSGRSCPALLPAWAGIATQLSPPVAAPLGVGAWFASTAAKLTAGLTALGAVWLWSTRAPAPASGTNASNQPAPASAPTSRQGLAVAGHEAQAGVTASGALTAPFVEPSDKPLSPKDATLPTLSGPQIEAHTVAGPSSASASPSPLEQERALLVRARAALDASAPTAALAYYARHEREFPKGQLAAARKRGRIVALCALGNSQQARGEAHAWANESPHDPLARQSITLCPKPSSQKAHEAEK